MLRNKKFIAVLAVLLVLVAAYNISFFIKERARKRPPERRAPAAAREQTGPKTGRPAAIMADWSRDPFWYTDPAHRTAVRQRPSRSQGRDGITVSAVMTENNKGYALIDGRVLGVGDSIDGYTIVEVKESSIRVRSRSGDRTIAVSP